MVRKTSVKMPSSKMKHQIARILTQENYIRGYKIVPVDKVRKVLTVYLKYNNDEPVILGLQKVSTPGRRVYAPLTDLPRVRGGMGTAILTTPKGVLTDRQAKMVGVGGEVLCYIW
ncbi:MAG: 30S ribosomal protein S8 [Candidatus Zixiibacteriota bacterium]